MPQSQFLKPGELPKAAPKIFPADCIIDWEKSSTDVHNLVRGLAPNPCAKSFLKSRKSIVSFKIFESKSEPESHSLEPGTITSDSKSRIMIACGKGFLNVINIQIEGKKRMGVEEFLRGFRINDFKITSNPQA